MPQSTVVCGLYNYKLSFVQTVSNFIKEKYRDKLSLHQQTAPIFVTLECTLQVFFICFFFTYTVSTIEDTRTEPDSSLISEDVEVPTKDVIERNCSKADYEEFKSEVLAHYREQFKNPADEVNPSLPPSESVYVMQLKENEALGKTSSQSKTIVSFTSQTLLKFRADCCHICLS